MERLFADGLKWLVIGVNFYVRFAIEPVVKFSKCVTNGQALFFDLGVSLLCCVEAV